MKKDVDRIVVEVKGFGCLTPINEPTLFKQHPRSVLSPILDQKTILSLHSRRVVVLFPIPLFHYITVNNNPIRSNTSSNRSDILFDQ